MASNVHTKAIGTALAAHFVSQGMTQVQVAARYSVSQSWVGRIYRGEFSKRAKTVSLMCEDTGVPFLHNHAEGRTDDSTKYRLLRLLDSIWEGTEEDANKLTGALLAIKQLRFPQGQTRK